MGALLVQDFFRNAQAVGKRLESELLLEHLLGVSRAVVFSNPERELTVAQATDYDVLWNRLIAGEPLAYLIGRKEFFGLNFSVDARVLIPRPETEHLVETVMALVAGRELPRILDVGTGSGAIALALAHSLPHALVWASDVSEGALEVARSNAKALGLERVQFCVSDLLVDLDWESWDLDVMVANLPYIGTDHFEFVDPLVAAHEPATALYGGTDGLALYGRLLDQINCSSKRSGLRWVVGEFGALQREAMAGLIGSFFPHCEVTFHKDLAGLDRYFVLEFNHA